MSSSSASASVFAPSPPVSSASTSVSAISYLEANYGPVFCQAVKDLSFQQIDVMTNNFVRISRDRDYWNLREADHSSFSSFDGMGEVDEVSSVDIEDEILSAIVEGREIPFSGTTTCKALASDILATGIINYKGEKRYLSPVVFEKLKTKGSLNVRMLAQQISHPEDRGHNAELFLHLIKEYPKAICCDLEEHLKSFAILGNNLVFSRLLPLSPLRPTFVLHLHDLAARSRKFNICYTLESHHLTHHIFPQHHH